MKLITTCLLIGCIYFSSFAQETPPFELSLVVPVSTPDGKRVISLKPYPRFHVQIKNISDTEQRLWKDWNTWGYYNLSFQVITPWDTTIARKLSPESWKGDFSDFWILPPNESVIIEIQAIGPHWKGFPIPLGRTVPVEIKAIYENKPDILAEEFGVWTGILESPPLSVVFK